MKNNAFNGNVIDLEASGLGSYSYPIEIGIVLGNGETYESLIAPIDTWTHWDPGAEAMHGISRKTLLKRGRSPQDVCDDLNHLCAGKVLYSDCWVYDSAWLNKLFAAAGVPLKFKCSPIEVVVAEEHIERWGEYKQDYIRRSQIVPHRALNDAIIISETLERLAVQQMPVPSDMATAPVALYA